MLIAYEPARPHILCGNGVCVCACVCVGGFFAALFVAQVLFLMGGVCRFAFGIFSGIFKYIHWYI